MFCFFLLAESPCFRYSDNTFQTLFAIGSIVTWSSTGNKNHCFRRLLLRSTTSKLKKPADLSILKKFWLRTNFEKKSLFRENYHAVVLFIAGKRSVVRVFNAAMGVIASRCCVPSNRENYNREPHGCAGRAPGVKGKAEIATEKEKLTVNENLICSGEQSRLRLRVASMCASHNFSEIIFWHETCRKRMQESFTDFF